MLVVLWRLHYIARYKYILLILIQSVIFYIRQITLVMLIHLNHKQVDTLIKYLPNDHNVVVLEDTGRCEVGGDDLAVHDGPHEVLVVDVSLEGRK